MQSFRAFKAKRTARGEIKVPEELSLQEFIRIYNAFIDEGENGIKGQAGYEAYSYVAPHAHMLNHLVPHTFWSPPHTHIWSPATHTAMSLVADECNEGMTPAVAAKCKELDKRMFAWLVSVCTHRGDIMQAVQASAAQNIIFVFLWKCHFFT